MKPYSLLIVLIFSISLLFNGCNSSNFKKSSEPFPTEQIEDPNKIIVATVNGHVLTYVDFMKQASATMPDVPRKNYANIYPMVLQGLIKDYLLGEQIKQNNIRVSKEQAEQKIIAEIGLAGKTLYEYKKILAEKNKDYKEIVEFARKRLELEMFFTKVSEGKIEVNETEIRERYNSSPTHFAIPERAHVYQILLSTEPDDPNDSGQTIKQSARQKAAEILAKIKAGGDFSELARENSSCPSNRNGGDLGFIYTPFVVHELQEIIRSIELNKISDIIETQYGYHIIKVTERIPITKRTLDQARNEIKQELLAKKNDKFRSEYIQNLIESAQISFPKLAGNESNSDPNFSKKQEDDTNDHSEKKTVHRIQTKEGAPVVVTEE